MAFQYGQLGLVLGWKHNNEPGLETEFGMLTAWPSSLGPPPTDGQLQGWVTAYEALPDDGPVKNPMANRRNRFDNAANDTAKLDILRELL